MKTEDKGKLVRLSYFKASGKWGYDGEYRTMKEHFFEIIEEVIQMLQAGNNPGMVEGACLASQYTTLVTCDSGPSHLIFPESILRTNSNFQEIINKTAKAISEEMNDHTPIRTEFCYEGDRSYVKEV